MPALELRGNARDGWDGPAGLRTARRRVVEHEASWREAMRGQRLVRVALILDAEREADVDRRRGEAERIAKPQTTHDLVLGHRRLSERNAVAEVERMAGGGNKPDPARHARGVGDDGEKLGEPAGDSDRQVVALGSYGAHEATQVEVMVAQQTVSAAIDEHAIDEREVREDRRIALAREHVDARVRIAGAHAPHERQRADHVADAVAADEEDAPRRPVA